MQLNKTINVATDLIKQYVSTCNMENELNDVQKRFLGFSYAKESLSLTDNQNSQHQLRFYEKAYGLGLVNQIAILFAIKRKPLETMSINLFKASELELTFFKRLEVLTKVRNNYVVTKIPLNYIDNTYSKMRHFQNIGDTWTAKIIGDNIISNPKFSMNSEMLHDLSFNYFGLDDPLATESLIKKSIDLPASSGKEYKTKISSLYILSLLYSRHLPRPLRDFSKSAKLLNDAFDIIQNNDIPVDDRLFEKVFNRNGYAFILFAEGKYKETVQMMTDLIKEIEPVVKEHSFAKLHLGVLTYNLYQVYNLAGNVKKAKETINKLFSIDPNDVEYKYDYIRLLFEQKEWDTAKKILDKIESSNNGDFVFQNSYYSQYYIGISMYSKALPYAKSAMIFNNDDKQANRFLYNYLVCQIKTSSSISNDTIKRYSLPNGEFYNELQNLLSDYQGLIVYENNIED